MFPRGSCSKNSAGCVGLRAFSADIPSEFHPQDRLKAELRTETPCKPKDIRTPTFVVPPLGGIVCMKDEKPGVSSFCAFPPDTPSNFHPEDRLKAELRTEAPRKPKDVRTPTFVVPPLGGTGRNAGRMAEGACLRKLLQAHHPSTFRNRMNAELQTRTPRKPKHVRTLSHDDD